MTSGRSLAAHRLLAADAATLDVPVDGGACPPAGSVVLHPGGSGWAGEVGVWDALPGTGRDVEVDEVFVVLSGRGSVAFADGSRLDLRPGAVVRLRAGDRTTWTVAERLRKVYVQATPA